MLALPTPSRPLGSRNLSIRCVARKYVRDQTKRTSCGARAETPAPARAEAPWTRSREPEPSEVTCQEAARQRSWTRSPNTQGRTQPDAKLCTTVTSRRDLRQREDLGLSLAFLRPPRRPAHSCDARIESPPPTPIKVTGCERGRKRDL